MSYTPAESPEKSWEADKQLRTETTDQGVVWENIFRSPKSPNHQLMLYNISYRTYLL